MVLLRATASQALTMYFLSTSSGLLYLILAHFSALDLKKRVGIASQWAQFIRLMARSDAAMFIIVNWMFAATSMFLMATTVLFLGRLSPRESNLLLDRLVKYCIFKLMFVSALKLPPTLNETAEWIAWFAVAGFMRIFIGMARDRLESLAAAPSAPVSAHVRAVALVLVILVRDAFAIRDLWLSAPVGDPAGTLGIGIGGVRELTAALGLPGTAGGEGGTMTTGPSSGVSRFVLCAYDLAVVMLEGIKTLIKYGVHCADTWATCRAARQARAAAAAAAADPANPQPLPPPPTAPTTSATSGGLLYHVELTTDMLTHVMTIVHYLHVWGLHGYTLHLVDMVLLMDVRGVMASLWRRAKTYKEYRTATYRLHHAFPDARPGDEEPCSICMEPMQVAKQLPCGHHFHLPCLRAWLQQSGATTFTCPNCRQPLLVGPPAAPRSLSMLEIARRRFHRRLTLLSLRLIRFLLEADQTVLQQQLRHMRRRQEEAMAAAVAGGAGAGRRDRSMRDIPAHEQPEGRGESSHPPPVSRLTKLVRRVWPWRGNTTTSSTAAASRPGAGQLPHGGWWRRWFGLPQAERNHPPALQEMEEEEEEGHMAGDDGRVGVWGPGGGSYRESDWYERETQQEEGEEVEEEREIGAGEVEQEELAAWPAGAPGELSDWGRLDEASDGEEEDEVAQWPSHRRPTHSPSGGSPASGRGAGHASQHAGHGQGHDGHGGAAGPSTRRRSPRNHLHQHTAAQAGARLGAGWQAAGGVAAGIGDAQAQRARVAVRRLGGPRSRDVPMWSAGVCEQLAAHITRSVRSSLAHGDSRAAVAGGFGDSEEVCSRRAPRPRPANS